MGKPLHRWHYSRDSLRLCQHWATTAGTPSSQVENQSVERASPTSTTRWKGQLTQPTLSAAYCESQGKYHSIYTKETYCTPSMCTLRACFVWSTHVTYTVTGRRKKNRVQSRKSAKREKEFSTYCKLYKFTYICIFDNGKLYKLMNIQHSCKYSLISIPIYV